ncbi:hypothetical protein NQ042_13260 [Corynebacterium phoceense]|uniref:type II toxin-antitoxin system HicB family antitoxin n=1 Tax=Corynebacterium phoceense TaxID=1686286 RepID=UPI00211CAE9C|nr:hypothetical protein [Corynebacterium phoceense]MCQ9335028.1 hypothetical protein [Corynebacterium phoceense]
MTTYTATITREGKNWLATVDNLAGVSTWGHSFKELDLYLREAIALAEDMPEGAEDSINIEWSISNAEPEVATALKVAQRRKELLREQAKLEPSIATAIETLRNSQWSTRDQAELFGMSAGRISQIAKSHG